MVEEVGIHTPHNMVNLYISAKSLYNIRPRPICKVYEMKQNAWCKVGQTEKVRLSDSPKFVTKIPIPL